MNQIGHLDGFIEVKGLYIAMMVDIVGRIVRTI